MLRLSVPHLGILAVLLRQQLPMAAPLDDAANTRISSQKRQEASR